MDFKELFIFVEGVDDKRFVDTIIYIQDIS